jgi:hypothetical protein
MFYASQVICGFLAVKIRRVRLKRLAEAILKSQTQFHRSKMEKRSSMCLSLAEDLAGWPAAQFR